MKKAILIICLITISACDKYPFLPDEYSEIILGNWKWKWTGCWNSGYLILADTSDYTLRITFDRQGKYFQYRNNTLTLSSNYRLDLSEIYDGHRIYKLTIEKDNEKYRALITGDTLSLSEYAVSDACEIFYLRQ